MSLSFELIGLFLALVWLTTLTVLFFKSSSHYNNLTRGLTNKTLKSVLENLLNETDANKKDIDNLRKVFDKLEKEGLLHIQKVGLLRFNPFKDTGGDQSFILTLVDGNNSGVIISNLYSRSGARWYAKKVKHGKGVEHELSEEETKALKQVA